MTNSQMLQHDSNKAIMHQQNIISKQTLSTPMLQDQS